MSFRLRMTLVGAWLLFTVSLTAWWLIFSLQQVDQVNLYKMLLWEGIILLFSLLAGGGSLFYLVLRTEKQSLKLKEFFATFSHDLKTSLASVRLQVEALREDFRDPEQSKDDLSPLFDRLMNDTIRLQVQLENSLFLANIEKQRLFFEDIKLSSFIRRFQVEWPNIKIEMPMDAEVRVDSRAFESALRNVIHNALTHGEAKQVNLSVTAKEEGFVEVQVSDDGKGFDGNPQKVAQLFERHTHSSGSGVGLYLVKNLLEKMKAFVDFQVRENKAFVVRMKIPGKAL